MKWYLKNFWNALNYMAGAIVGSIMLLAGAIWVLFCAFFGKNVDETMEGL